MVARNFEEQVDPMNGIERKIVEFHQDAESHWVAQLECGHNQHVRHSPPWFNRPWVTTVEGRNNALGEKLSCVKCAERAPPDRCQ
ncbi:DUF3565 domain-containing protein [Panacagrimonas sp.]|uniref:DUF3565 domain-containing protein n=1 Tax=Panacagrimonas sp. TaxID=2480088 RepID=UPI003B51D136